MLKPLIGLTTSRMLNPLGDPAVGMNASYSNSITEAGGVPILIPLSLNNDDEDLLLSRLDGVLFTGGYDIDPRLYGNPFHPKAKGIDADRDRLEIHLVQAIIRLGKPFFGICRGCQVINVALGGTLYEDLSDQRPGDIQHDNHHHPRNYLAHQVTIQSKSQLSGILGKKTVQVNSLHHQGVNRLANSLNAIAHAPDGLIEAIELSSYPFGMAVQWHPEELQEYQLMRGLFQAFVKPCQPEAQDNR
jgi:putative glutamine amidotransferase